MTTGQTPPALAVIRPRDHIENVRADAIRAATEIAAGDDNHPDFFFISHAISWALGDHDIAPFTRRRTPAPSQRPDIEAEITNCRSFLHTTAWSESAEDRIDAARAVLKILEWLTGADDRPPTYGRQTEPGDLVGGRGRIVRTEAAIRSMRSLAQAKLASGQASHALCADWHHGVIDTLHWVLGDRSVTPMLATAQPGMPDGGRIAVEQAEAEDHLVDPASRPGIAYHYADAVACTCRWLLGNTTRPPVTDPDPDTD
jgi:hypothetical protein